MSRWPSSESDAASQAVPTPRKVCGDLLCSETDATCVVPETRWHAARYHDPNPSKVGKIVTRRGGFLSEIDQFDPQFFGMSPREAHSLDPQQRLLLHATWEALEDGGIPADGLAGTDVGVFIGGFTLDYQLLQNQGRTSRYRFKSHSATGMMMTMLANRISHAFDFRGPSMTIDTACSGSLVAVHLAAQSIWNGECDLALAGGVNIMIGPNTAIAESKSGFLSPEGRSKAFDDSADGYARGEGGAVVVIKPLAQGARRRRRDLRADPRHGGVAGRPHRRHHRAPRGSAGSGGPNCPSPRGCPADRGRVRGGTRHRHAARRSHRDASTLECADVGPVGDESPADRLDQDQHRSPRGRRRGGRTDQGGVGCQARLHSGESAPPDSESTRVPCGSQDRRSRYGSAVPRLRAPHRRCELIRIRRHQRPRGARRAACPGGHAPSQTIRRSGRRRSCRSQPAARKHWSRPPVGWPAIWPRTPTSRCRIWVTRSVNGAPT